MDELQRPAGRRLADLDVALAAGPSASSATGTAAWNWKPVSSAEV